MRAALAALAFLLFPATAAADVTAASASGFHIEAETALNAQPADIWRTMAQIERWWSPAHTYSGDARHMRLEPRAGGCWCEQWDGSSIEHGRVIAVLEREGVRTLRLYAALGPLQAMGAQGVLTFTITPAAGGARLSMSYRVSGEPGSAIGAMAAPVDGVMMEQFGRLSRLVTTGSPD